MENKKRMKKRKELNLQITMQKCHLSLFKITIRMYLHSEELQEVKDLNLA